MGLLPVFLTLFLFIFLWGLVNYYSFVAKRDRIRGFRDEEEKLLGMLAEQVTLLSGAITATSDVRIPVQLTTGASGTSVNTGYAPDYPADLARQWHQFVNEHSPLSADEQVRNLLKGLEETAALLFRTRSRLQAAVGDYNRHRQQMPYRLIALLFGFRPVQ